MCIIYYLFVGSSSKFSLFHFNSTGRHLLFKSAKNTLLYDNQKR